MFAGVRKRVAQAAGQPLGIRFPAYNIGLSTLLRVELASGDRYAHLLSPGEDSWTVPEASSDGVSSALREGRQAVLEGAVHFFGSSVLDEKGLLPRPEPVPEKVETAWVGVTS